MPTTVSVAASDAAAAMHARPAVGRGDAAQHVALGVLEDLVPADRVVEGVISTAGRWAEVPTSRLKPRRGGAEREALAVDSPRSRALAVADDRGVEVPERAVGGADPQVACVGGGPGPAGGGTIARRELRSRASTCVSIAAAWRAL